MDEQLFPESQPKSTLHVFLDSSCSSPLPPSPGYPCTAPGSQECPYPSSNCCCGQCEDIFYCASDSTTGVKVWHLRHVCPAGCGEGAQQKHHLWLGLILRHLSSSGVVTSPNYPRNYPNSLAITEKIQVQEGLVIILQFTAFRTTNCNDHLRITDADGTTLVEKACGSSMPTNITSTSNSIEMLFKTDASSTKEGWSVSWSAVTPGMIDHNFRNHISPLNTPYIFPYIPCHIIHNCSKIGLREEDIVQKKSSHLLVVFCRSN